MTTKSCRFFAASEALLYGGKEKVAFLDSPDQLSPFISRGKKTVHGIKGYAHPASKILTEILLLFSLLHSLH